MNSKAVELIGQFWQLMATNDFRSVGAVLSDDFVLDCGYILLRCARWKDRKDG